MNIDCTFKHAQFLTSYFISFFAFLSFHFLFLFFFYVYISIYKTQFLFLSSLVTSFVDTVGLGREPSLAGRGHDSLLLLLSARVVINACGCALDTITAELALQIGQAEGGHLSGGEGRGQVGGLGQVQGERGRDEVGDSAAHNVVAGVGAVVSAKTATAARGHDGKYLDNLGLQLHDFLVFLGQLSYSRWG